MLNTHPAFAPPRFALRTRTYLPHAHTHHAHAPPTVCRTAFRVRTLHRVTPPPRTRGWAFAGTLPPWYPSPHADRPPPPPPPPPYQLYGRLDLEQHWRFVLPTGKHLWDFPTALPPLPHRRSVVIHGSVHDVDTILAAPALYPCPSLVPPHLLPLDRSQPLHYPTLGLTAAHRAHTRAAHCHAHWHAPHTHPMHTAHTGTGWLEHPALPTAH